MDDIINYITYEKAKHNADIIKDEESSDLAKARILTNFDKVKDLFFYMILNNIEHQATADRTMALKGIIDNNIPNVKNRAINELTKTKAALEEFNVVDLDFYEYFADEINRCESFLQELIEQINTTYFRNTTASLQEALNAADVNATAERAYLKLITCADKDIYNNLFNCIIADMGNIGYALSKDYLEITENAEMLKGTLQNLGMKCDDETVYLTYYKMAVRSLESVLFAGRFYDYFTDALEERNKGEHMIYYFDRNNVLKLIKDFNKNDKDFSNKNNTPCQLFSNSLKHIKERIAISDDKTREVLIDSKELEDVMYDIVNQAPHQLETFAQFLADEKLPLPLAPDRLYLYVHAIAESNIDKDVAAAAFSQEHVGTFPDIDKYRKLKGIKRNSAAPVEPKKCSNNNILQFEQIIQHYPSK